jgi:hypothetical protein
MKKKSQTCFHRALPVVVKCLNRRKKIPDLFQSTTGRFIPMMEAAFTSTLGQNTAVTALVLLLI